MALIVRLCNLYSVLATLALVCAAPWAELSPLRMPLDSPAVERSFFAAGVMCFAAFLFELSFYFVLYVKSDARIVSVSHSLGGKADTQLMIFVNLVLLITHVLLASGCAVHQYDAGLGGPRPVYSARKLEWCIVVPVLMWVAGRPKQSEPKSEKDTAEAKRPEAPGGVVACIVATVVYILCSWYCLVAVDPQVQNFFFFLCLLGAVIALVEEGIRASFALRQPGNRYRGALCWFQVISFIIYGVNYVAGWTGHISPAAEQIFYTFLDVSAKLIHTWILFAIRQSELLDTVAKAVAEAKTGADDLRNLITNANAPIFALDLDFKITSWNRKMAALTGIRQDGARGRSLLELVSSGGPEAAEVIRSALKDEASIPFEVDIGEGEGDRPEITIMMSVTPTRDPEGKVIGVVGVGQDMTELLAVKDEEARKAKFMAVVAHELRSPLHGIIGITDSLSEREKEGLKKKQLGMVKNCATRLLDLVVSIMEATSYMEQGAGRKAPRPLNCDQVELSKVVGEVVLLVGNALDKSGQPLIRKGVSLLNTVQDDLPIIQADAHKCTQVFHNLITNACKFTAQGRITIASKVDRNKEWVEISVADTGKGIATDSLERIFKPFEQEEGTEARKFEGIGLGLSIVKGVIEQHGGTVRVTSEVGKGSIFTVRLPLRMQPRPHVDGEDDDEGSEDDDDGSNADCPLLSSAADHPAFAPSEAPTSELPFMGLTRKLSQQSLASLSPARMVNLQPDCPGTPRRRPTILSVDDDFVNQTVIESTLSGDYEIHAAMDGSECLEYLTTHSRLPDVVLLDVMMPGLTGFEVCWKIRNELGISAATLPIIMLSARSPVNDSIVQGLEVGCNDYLSKPFDKTVLHARVQAALNMKRLHNIELESATHAELLHSMLPPKIVARLKAGESTIAESHDNVAILVTDIVGWTSITESMSTAQGITLLNSLFCAFDDITEQHGVHKVETVGDMYMCAAGHDGQEDHAGRMLQCALEMLKAVKRIRPPVTGIQVQVRIGAHSGPACTGVVGKKVPRYCFFGEAVEVARRLESHGVPDCVHISDSMRQACPKSLDLGVGVQVAERGAIEIGGKGQTPTHLVVPAGTAEWSSKKYQRKDLLCRFIDRGTSGSGAQEAERVQGAQGGGAAGEAAAKAELLRALGEARDAAGREAAALRQAHAAELAEQRQRLDEELRGRRGALSELQQARQAEGALQAELEMVKSRAELEARDFEAEARAVRASFEQRISESKAAAVTQAVELEKAAAKKELEALQKAHRSLAAEAEAQRKLCSALREELQAEASPEANGCPRVSMAKERQEDLQSAHMQPQQHMEGAWSLPGSKGAGATLGAPAAPLVEQGVHAVAELGCVYRMYEAKEQESQHLQLEVQLSRQRLRAARAELASLQSALDSRDSELAHALLGARRLPDIPRGY